MRFLRTDTTVALLRRAALAWVFSGASVFAQGPQPVVGINPPPGPVPIEYGSGVDRFCTIGEVTYFNAQDATHGYELWRSDGTTAGTRLVKDLIPGGDGGEPKNFHAMGDVLFFTAWNRDYLIYSLWKSDGTEAGTVHLTSGTQTEIVPLGVLGDRLYYFHNGNLWKTDGTAGNTVQISSSLFESIPHYGPTALVSSGKLFFTQDKENRAEIWVTDGSAAGTTLVSTIPVASGYDLIFTEYLIEAGGALFVKVLLFDSSSTDSATLYLGELWEVGGNSGDARKIADLQDGNVKPAAWNGGVYFVEKGDDGVRVNRLEGATGVITTLRTFPSDTTARYGVRFFAGDGLVYFNIHNGTAGHELWKTDGSIEGTAVIRAVPNPYKSWLYGGILYFAAISEAEVNEVNYILPDVELWRSDSTPEGTYAIRNFRSPLFSGSFQDLVVLGDKVIFSAYSIGQGDELWVSDDSPGNAELLKNIHSESQIMPEPVLAVDPEDPLGGVYYKVYHWDQLSSYPAGLWKNNGGADDNIPIWKAEPGAEMETGLLEVVRLGDSIYFFTTHQFREPSAWRGVKLWKSDGTTEGTHPVVDLELVPGVSMLREIGGKLYFTSLPPGGGEPLYWKSDGTAEGTVRINEFAPSVTRYPLEQTWLGNAFYFFNNSNELWKSDGSPEGTVMVKDISPASLSFQTSLLVAGDKLFFVDSNERVWRSDGTTEGNLLMEKGSASYPYGRGPVATADAVYFTFSGNQLWKYDLNSVTPILISYRTSPGYSVQLLRAIGRTLYFIYTSSTGGNELWKTDGNPEGTTKVTAVPSAFGVESTIAYAGELFFSVDDGIHGRELWRSDGSEAGTRMVKDIAVGSGAALDSDPAFRIFQSKLYFHASTEDAGEQLYVYDASTAAPPMIGQVSNSGVNHYDASFMVTIDAGGVATRAEFEYGETTAYGFAAPIALTPSNGFSDQISPAMVSGLKPGTTYHYRVMAANAGGTTFGAEGSFTTLATQPPVWNGFSFDAYYQAQKSIPIAALLANASDPDGDVLSITAVSAGSQGGSVELAGDFIQYTPANGFQGAETFLITLSDFPNGGTSASVTANVSGPFGNSHLPAEIISMTGGLKNVRFHAIPSRTYRMERSFDLKTWALISRPTADIEGIIKLSDQTSSTGSAFYRLAYP